MRFGAVNQSVVGVPIRKAYIGRGSDAIANTLRVMRDIIRVSAQNYLVRRWAEKIVAGIPQDDDLARVDAVADYIRARSYYLRDTQGTELLKTPLVSLNLWDVGEKTQLDCDDFTVLSLSLLKSIGFPVALRAAAYGGDSFRHVYGLVQVRVDGKRNWIPLDLTADHGSGWEHPAKTRTMDMVVA